MMTKVENAINGYLQASNCTRIYILTLIPAHTCKYSVTDHVVPFVSVDKKAKDVFQHVLLIILKRNFCYDVNRTKEQRDVSPCTV